MYLQFNESSNIQQIYSLLIGAVVPRPIAWVSTISAQGIANLAPFSFFTVASINPPVLCINVLNPNNKAQKDTLANLSQTQNAVIHVVTESQLPMMNASCADYAPEVDEFAELHIKTTASQWVDAPSIAECLVRIECQLQQIITVSHQPMGGHLVLLKVLGVYVDDPLYQAGNPANPINAQLLNAVGKMGGNFYSKAQPEFELVRPVLK